MKTFIALLLVLTFIGGCSHQPAVQYVAVQYDLLIRNAMLVDGTGNEPYRGDLAITGDTIAAMGNLGNATALRVIQADGKALSPGFIDLHSHAENDVLKRPDAKNNILQGVTTILAGNCGGSPVDIGDYFERLAANPTSLNVALLLGHNSVRQAVMQRENRHATAAEIEAMERLVAQAMGDGAFGLSSGLIYIPGSFAPPAELEALANVAHSYEGFYASHIRSEGSDVLNALQEAIDVGAQVGLPVHISHHKTAGPSAWGLSKDTLALIDMHRAKGIDISLDQYPYTASNTNLGVLMPPWSLAGGQQAFLERMQQSASRSKILEDVKRIIDEQRAGSEFWRIQISSYPHDPSLVGKNFEKVLKQRNIAVNLHNAAELAIEIQVNGGGRGIYHTMQDEDVERIMRHPHTSIASDGAGVEWQKGSPHPRNYGTYPRTLALYVRDKGLLSLPEAVKKMTSMPANRMGLIDRGLLKEGYKADVLMWDPSTIADNSTFADPHQYSTGIDYVIVNGVVVVEDGEMTDARPGLALHSNSQ
ncbi:amidohydrolase family protein [Glaciecola sp. SC05]|uniref:N-acyl-D-amino-acid deacylase family protein n=1 Tax=Glaciecola sp. SC05 TaxID=1987355 RepID=UPI0035288907